MFSPMIFSAFDRLQTDPGDTRFNLYLLEHSFRWVRSLGAIDFWDPAFFYPAKNVISYSDLMIGQGPFYWPFRFMGFGPESSYQFWMMTLASLNFGLFYLFLRKWFSVSSIAASVGAFLFSFGASRVNQLGHQQLLSQFYPLLSIYALFSVVSTLDRDDAFWSRKVWIGIFYAGCVLQIYSAFYYAWFLFFALSIVALWSLILPRYWPYVFKFIKKEALSFVLIGIIAGIALLPATLHYLRAATTVGYRQYNWIIDLLPPVQAWFHMGDWSVPYAVLKKLKIFRTIVMEHEQRLGIGLLSTGLLTWGLIRARKNKVVLLAGLLLLSSIVLLSQFKGHSLWAYVFPWFPGAKSLRAYSRMAVFLLLVHGIGVALAVDYLLQIKKSFYIMGGLIAVVMLEQLVVTDSFSWSKRRQEVDFLASKINPKCASFVYTPMAGEEWVGISWKFALDAMWAGLETGIPTWNGHSGNGPPGWPLLDTVMANGVEAGKVNSAVESWSNQPGISGTAWCRIQIAPLILADR